MPKPTPKELAPGTPEARMPLKTGDVIKALDPAAMYMVESWTLQGRAQLRDLATHRTKTVNWRLRGDLPIRHRVVANRRYYYDRDRRASHGRWVVITKTQTLSNLDGFETEAQARAAMGLTGGNTDPRFIPDHDSPGAA